MSAYGKQRLLGIAVHQHRIHAAVSTYMWEYRLGSQRHRYALSLAYSLLLMNSFPSCLLVCLVTPAFCTIPQGRQYAKCLEAAAMQLLTCSMLHYDLTCQSPSSAVSQPVTDSFCLQLHAYLAT